MPDPDLLGRLPEGVGQEASSKARQIGSRMGASSKARHSASGGMPLRKLDKVERAEWIERIVVSRPRRGMTV
jgi:hypothetical protein